MKLGHPGIKNSTNLLKGRIAEAIIESLFIEAGHKVRRYGQEWRTTCCPVLCAELFRFTPLDNQQLKRPDFAIMTTKDQIETVEVKFSTAEVFVYEIAKDVNMLQVFNDHFPRTKIVIVCPDADDLIRVLPPPYVDADHDPINTIPIHEIVEWDLPLSICNKYCEIVRSIPFHLFH